LRSRKGVKSKLRYAIIFLLAITLFVIPYNVLCEWPNSPDVNVPICTASGIQEHPRITTDGETGAIIVWQDISSSSSDIYAQRVDARGKLRWTQDGVAICLEKGDQWFPNLVSDGEGGAIIAWWDRRNGFANTDIYAQRIDSNGRILWGPGGIPVCTALGEQQEFDITTDGKGGAIIVWHDYRAKDDAPDIYAQRINALGKAVWKHDGVVICRQPGGQNYPNIVSDNSGGALIAWHDWRNGDGDVYAQHINDQGQPLWQEHGIPVCKRPGHQWYPAIASDGENGFVLVWMDERNGKDWDLYSQRVSADGRIMWNKDGVPVCIAKGDQYDYSIIGDISGNTFITWRDQRSGEWDIYAQKIDPSGSVKFVKDGLAICNEPKDQYNPNIISDDADGVIVAWWDERNTNSDIYAQRIGPKGVFLWTEKGAAISLAEGGQQDAYLVNSGVGSAIITWWDKRKVEPDIYAQRVFSEQ